VNLKWAYLDLYDPDVRELIRDVLEEVIREIMEDVDDE
jgi:hypothetical protein